MTAIYNIVDIASKSVYVLYQIISYPKLERKVSTEKYSKFLLQIGEKLVKPVTLQLTERLIGLQQKTEIAKQCFNVSITVVQTAFSRNPRDEPPKKKRFYVFPRKSDRKIKQFCGLCKRNVCNDHPENIGSCNACKEENEKI